MRGSRPGWPRAGTSIRDATTPGPEPATITEVETPMSADTFNKYRAAAQALQRGRDQLVDAMADEVLDQGEDLLENNFLFNEFLENQGTRLHFLTLVLSQLEQSAEAFDELVASQPPPTPPRKAASETAKKRRPRAKKMPQKASAEGQADEH